MACLVQKHLQALAALAAVKDVQDQQLGSITNRIS
jgi:hypothetical protein